MSHLFTKSNFNLFSHAGNFSAEMECENVNSSFDDDSLALFHSHFFFRFKFIIRLGGREFSVFNLWTRKWTKNVASRNSVSNLKHFLVWYIFEREIINNKLGIKILHLCVILLVDQYFTQMLLNNLNHYYFRTHDDESLFN